MSAVWSKGSRYLSEPCGQRAPETFLSPMAKGLQRPFWALWPKDSTGLSEPCGQRAPETFLSPVVKGLQSPFWALWPKGSRGLSEPYRQRDPEAFLSLMAKGLQRPFTNLFWWYFGENTNSEPKYYFLPSFTRSISVYLSLCHLRVLPSFTRSISVYLSLTTPVCRSMSVYLGLSRLILIKKVLFLYKNLEKSVQKLQKWSIFSSFYRKLLGLSRSISVYLGLSRSMSVWGHYM